MALNQAQAEFITGGFGAQGGFGFDRGITERCEVVDPSTRQLRSDIRRLEIQQHRRVPDRPGKRAPAERCRCRTNITFGRGCSAAMRATGGPSPTS